MSEKPKIQCPECGGMIIPTRGVETKNYKCLQCQKIFTETEIRERCGI